MVELLLTFKADGTETLTVDANDVETVEVASGYIYVEFVDRRLGYEIESSRYCDSVERLE